MAVLLTLSSAKAPHYLPVAGAHRQAPCPTVPTYSQPCSEAKISVRAWRLVPCRACSASREPARATMTYWVLEAMDGSKTPYPTLLYRMAEI